MNSTIKLGLLSLALRYLGSAVYQTRAALFSSSWVTLGFHRLMLEFWSLLFSLHLLHIHRTDGVCLKCLTVPF